MKKFLILILIIAFTKVCGAQVDTAVWAFRLNQVDGKYSFLQNRSTYQGVGAGQLVFPIYYDAATIDTSKWTLLRNQTDGLYSWAENRVVYYGLSAQTVKVTLWYNLNPGTPNLYGYTHKDSSYTITGKWVWNDTVKADWIKSRNGSTKLTLFAGIGNSTVLEMDRANDWFTWTLGATPQVRLSYSSMDFGAAGNTGYPLINIAANDLTAVTYSYRNDPNLGWMRRNVDSMAAVAGGAAQLEVGTNSTTIKGNLNIATVGKRIFVKEGTNAIMGVATLSAGTVVVSTTAVTDNSRIFLTGQSNSGTEYGFVKVSDRTAGTSFTITSYRGNNTTTVASGDGSTVAWFILEPAP